ncbi:CD109 antigen [Chionoecetes opilio]|uniref:CD109 antigen n=1 Tax=Chionoecetes opilio TaxID=41210 RepID=A0A8J4YB31_CHIOP|nr:CD109 antigen [Chionoecetes opilio]
MAVNRCVAVALGLVGVTISVVVVILVLALQGVSVRGQDLGRGKDDPRRIPYGSDNRWKNILYNEVRMRNRYNHPTHIVVAPRTLFPGAVYRCVVSILYLEHPVDVRAFLRKDGVELASARSNIIKGYPETLLLQGVGEYRLLKSRPLSSNAPSCLLPFSPSSSTPSTLLFLVLLLRFRIILLTTELRPYDDPVDVYILDPDGYVMRRWPSRPTNVGVVSMSFDLPFLPKVGWWGIKAHVNGQEEVKSIKVEKWYTPRYEVKMFMPKYFLETDEAIVGDLGGEFSNDKGAYGNATLRLYIRSQGDEVWNYVMQQEIAPLDAEDEYSFPMEALARKVPKLDGSEVRVEAEIHESFTGINGTGFTMAKIINSSISCMFLGSSPYIFKPGMPFSASVAISYHDLMPLSKEKLQMSRMVVKGEAILGGGGRKTIFEIEIPQANAEDEETEFLDESWRYNKRLEAVKADDPNYDPTNFDYNYNFDQESGSRYLTDSELVERKMDMFVRNQQFEKYRDKGVFHFTMDVPDTATKLTLTAAYQDDDGDLASASAQAIAYYSPKKQYIGVETSSTGVTVGEFVVFHVRSSFNMETFNYLVMAKEMILFAAMEVLDTTSSASVKTISVPVSSEMAPAFRIFVYHLTQSHEIISDSITIPVNGISRHKTKLVINQDKDHSVRSVELGTYSTAGAFYGVSGVREFTYAMQGGNELSHASVLHSLHGFTNNTRTLHKMAWRPREGFQPEEVEYYTSGNYGPDSNRTFDFSGLVVFSDAVLGVVSGYEYHKCNETQGYSPCLMGGCFPTNKKCDGFDDCADKYDEVNCGDKLADTEVDFRIHRYVKFSDFFDTEDGDWLWLDINIGHKGHEQNNIELPKVDDPYVLNAFSVSKEFGFGLIEMPQEYSAMPPMYISLEMPDSCRRGEQVGMRIMIFNNLPQEMMVLLVLHGADTHRFVAVEDNGVVDFYRPRVEAGDHQHLLSVFGLGQRSATQNS